MKKPEKCNNLGVTLVELLVTIAILSTLVGASTVSLSLIYSKDTEKAARLIDGSIGTLRMHAMNKEGNWYLLLSDDGTAPGVKICRELGGVTSIVEEEALPKRIVLSCSKQESGVETDITGPYVKIAFDRGKGSVDTVSVMNNLSNVGSAADPAPPILNIQVKEKNGTRQSDIKLIRLTGKHYVEG